MPSHRTFEIKKKRKGDKFLPFSKAREYVRGLGLKNQTEWQTWSKSGKRPKNIPSSPSTVYPDEWKNWGDWIGNEFLTFEKAREYIRGLKFKNTKEWSAWIKLGKRPNNIPSHPYAVYHDEWKNWGDWLGTGNMHSKDFLSFDEAREYAKGLGLKSQTAWYTWNRSGKRPKNIPASPYAIYHDEWENWGDWLGTGNMHSKDFLSFDEAREYARGLGLKVVKEWHAFSKSDKRPDNIPSNPQRSYLEEWKGWEDWLG